VVEFPPLISERSTLKIQNVEELRVVNKQARSGDGAVKTTKRTRTKSGTSLTPSGKQAALFEVEAPEPFKKASAAIHISAKHKALTLAQHKVYNALIAKALEQHREHADLDRPRTRFQISWVALNEATGLNTNNRDYMRGVINSLIGCVVNWDYLEADRGEVWAATGLLADADVDRTNINYEFSAKIRDLLVHPEMYATIDMRIVRAFTRAASLVLWENVVRFEGIRKTAELSMETLRQLFLGQEAEKTLYPTYKEFNRNVLSPAIREANEVSDHIITAQEVREGRRVSAIRFAVSRKHQVVHGDAPDADLVATLASLGIPNSEARKLLSSNPEQDVRDALNYVQVRQSKMGAAPIDNVPAYFRKALSEKWKTQEPVQNNGKAESRSPTPTGGTTEHEVRDRFNGARVNEARRYFEELNAAEQVALMTKYNEWQTHVKWRLDATHFKKPSAGAQKAFLSWLAVDTWGEPTTEDLFHFMLEGGQLVPRG